MEITESLFRRFGLLLAVRVIRILTKTIQISTDRRIRKDFLDLFSALKNAR